MQEATVVVRHEVGLHARPAALFVQLATKYESEILVAKAEGDSDREVNAKSILSLLTLGVNQGTAVRIRATGKDEEDAVKALRELIESDFGEAGKGS
jgi:phosphotransferase system HPr (HPr) family protein